MTVHQWLAEWSSWGWPFLANHLWQATLISLISFVAAGFLSKGPGRARYAVWLIASVKFAVPSALLVSLAQSLGIALPNLLASASESRQGSTVILQLTTPITQLDDSASAVMDAGSRHTELFCVLTIVWLAGIVALLALWHIRRRRFHIAMRSVLNSDSSRELQALDRARSRLGSTYGIRLSILPGTVEPGVWGVWRPIVFLPERMAEELSNDELETVMMHEVIHIVRWDNLIANLHRLLCCLLWFHPIVWMLDRLLLTERERACDEEVIRLGGAPDIYASSLVKVLRFCLEWSVAGASNATGSNLGRRVKRIMSKNIQVRLSAWQRISVASIAVLVITLSVVAGLVTRDGVGAQTGKPTRGASGGIEGGVPGGVPGGVSGGIPGGIEGWTVESVEYQEQVLERLTQAPETVIEFKNSTKAPVVITDARARAVPRDKDGVGDEFAVIPIVTISNSTDRRIKGFSLEFRSGLDRRAYYERTASLVEPRGVYTSGGQKRFIILVGGPATWSVRVGGVVFEDGEVWGSVPPPPPPPQPPPPPRAEMNQLERAPETAVRFNNRDGAPVSITGATVKAVRIEDLSPSNSEQNSGERYLIRLAVQVVNNTSRRINGVAIEYPSSETKNRMRTYASVKIEPHESYNLYSPQQNEPGYGALLFRGDPNSMEARVMGVRFEDGEVWGSFPAPLPPPLPPPPPVATVEAGEPKLVRKSGGVFAESATHRVIPESPPLARTARITGSVVVEVTLDEAGSVIEARAISGHPLLRDAAVGAARQWQFAPTLLSGVAVKVIGNLTFYFEP